MKRIKLFDKNLYFEALRQLKTLGVVSFVILMLQAVFIPLFSIISYNIENKYEEISSNLAEKIEFVTLIPLQYLIVILFPIMTIILFGFIDSRKASDFYHSLPVRRETMYITYILAVITWCAGLFAVPTLVEALLFWIDPHVELTGEYLCIVIADIFVIGLYLSAVAVLSKNIAGNRFGQFAVFFMIIYLPRFFIFIIKELIQYIAPTIILGMESSLIWDFSWNLLWFTGISQWRSVVYTLILAIVYLIIGGVIFVKRKSEKAEDVAVSRKVQLALRIIPALTFSFLPMYAVMGIFVGDNDFDGSMFLLLIILYIITVVIYFLYELITTRRLRSVITAAPGLLILLLSHVILFAGIEGYAYAEKSRCPDASDIQYIKLVSSDGYGDYRYYLFDYNYRYFEETLCDIKFSDDDTKNYVASMLKNNNKSKPDELTYGNDNIAVEIKTGTGRLYRMLYAKDFDGLLAKMFTSEQFGSVSDYLPMLDGYRIEECELYYKNSILSIDFVTRCDIYEKVREELAALSPIDQYKLARRNYGTSFYLQFGIAKVEKDLLKGYNVLDYYPSFFISIDKELMPETYDMVMEFYHREHSDWDE